MQQLQFKNEILIHKDQMYRLALRILRDENDAEDVVQDCLLKLWDKRQVLQDISNKKSFALTTVRNACIDAMRKHRAFTNKEETILRQSDERNPEQLLDHTDQLNQVKAIINQMSDQHREVIHLREIEGMEYEEMSEITGFSVNNLRVMLSRARKEIKAKLDLQMNFGITNR